MTASIYHALKDCIGAPLQDIKDILDAIAIDFFHPLFEPLPVPVNEESTELPVDTFEFTDAQLPSVIMFLIYAYSKESKMLIMGADFSEEKVRIADKVSLPVELHGKVLKLKSEKFRKVMMKYLDYQGSRAFKHLQLKRDMYEAVEANSFQTLFAGEDGSMDAKALTSLATMKNNLLEEILDYEEKLKSEFKFVYDNIDDAEQASKDSKKATSDNGNIENSPWLNFNKKKTE